MTTTGSPRRQDLDLMRAAVVGGLIFFHTARIFDPLDFYVKDQPPNLPLTLFVYFAGLWGMPLLFWCPAWVPGTRSAPAPQPASSGSG
jgi:hypothetical protein